VTHEGYRLGRRRLLGVGVVLALSGLPVGALAHNRDAGTRTLGFYNLHTGETLSAIYWADGGYVSESLARIDLFLRDYRTGDVAPIDRRLLDLLHALRGSLDSEDNYHVVSGYRSPKTNEMLAKNSNGVAKKSLHMKGMAIDLRLPGRKLAAVRRAAVELQLGGVGYYPKPGFVHLDVGRVRYW
jgi:uncharacterized protein YcbK (DUF882 family)